MARKVFISFLGTTDYFPSRYYRGKKFCSDEEKYVQIAALQYVQRQAVWTQDDVAYILLTKLAESRNWKDNGYIERNGNPNVGLESTIQAKNFPFPCKAITDIPEGKNEKEIWQIFQTIHNLIQDGDELYFDITHGYRYLPMLVVVLGNYSKFLEKAKIMQILYGNYEGRDRDENGKYIEPPRSPLVDLKSFSTLQDWTYAVADFINNGNSDRMSSLTNEIAVPKIKKGNARADALYRLVTSTHNFVKDMQTCRGGSIIEAQNIKELSMNLKEVQDVLQMESTEASVDELLIPVFEKIRDLIKSFDVNSNTANGFQAVDWCLEHRLYQQAVTILQETVKTYFLLKLNMDAQKEENRELIVALLNTANYTSSSMLPAEIGESIGETEWAKSMKAIAKSYNELRKLRNDFNHAGFNGKPATPADIETTARKIFNDIQQKLGLCSSI